MKKDINIIVDVDPDEAGLLIGLIETLMHEWYIIRHEREQRLKRLVQTSLEKDRQDPVLSSMDLEKNGEAETRTETDKAGS